MKRASFSKKPSGNSGQASGRSFCLVRWTVVEKRDVARAGAPHLTLTGLREVREPREAWGQEEGGTADVEHVLGRIPG